MRNFVQPGDVLTLTAPSGGVESGEGLLVGRLFVVAANSAAEGDPFPAQTWGVFDLPKAAVAVTEGAAAWWDPDEGEVTNTDNEGANTQIGYVIAAAGSGAAEARVLLMHTMVFLDA